MVEERVWRGGLKVWEQQDLIKNLSICRVYVVARQDADCADGNKDVRIEATLLIPYQKAKSNQAVKSCCETALIRLCETYKRCGSSPIDRIPRRG